MAMVGAMMEAEMQLSVVAYLTALAKGKGPQGKTVMGNRSRIRGR